MRLLFLSPQPFFQERGTPIAVRLALEVLTERIGQGQIERLDLLCYGEGQVVSVPGVNIVRIYQPNFLRGIGPGVSLKKLLCDVIFLFTALGLVWRSRKTQYDLVHAVEESVFIAWLIKSIWKIPYIYDMDSSLAMQLTEKWYVLRPLQPIFNALERLAVRGSRAVVPVCDALAAIAERHGSKFTSVLSDISLLKPQIESSNFVVKAELKLAAQAHIVMYIGNLEPYQGIDLLLEAFAISCAREASAHLVIVGGQAQHIAAYARKVSASGIESRVHFLGARPVDQLDRYIMQADILVSPRVRGNNTPMKVYSYLHSGRAILATKLFTHTQVLTPELAELCEPDAQSIAAGLLKLLGDPAYRETLGSTARRFAEEHFTFEVFRRKLHSIYERIGFQAGTSYLGLAANKR